MHLWIWLILNQSWTWKRNESRTCVASRILVWRALVRQNGQSKFQQPQLQKFDGVHIWHT